MDLLTVTIIDCLICILFTFQLHVWEKLDLDQLKSDLQVRTQIHMYYFTCLYKITDVHLRIDMHDKLSYRQCWIKGLRAWPWF